MGIQETLLEKSIPEPNSGCWIWTAATNSWGYGYIRHAGKQMRAHRLSYEIFVGPIPDGLELDHLCRLRCCINPGHLEPVTKSVNTQRGHSGKRTGPNHCQRGHEFTPENTWRQKRGRLCRECALEKVRRFRARKRGI